MTKGKPWPADDERKLKDWFTSGIADLGILAFSFDGQYTEEGIRQKLIKLGLLKEAAQLNVDSFPELEWPKELPTVEETLKTLAAALKLLESSTISSLSVLRLRSLISGAKVYQELFVEYVHYREIEAELLELRRKYEELLKKSEDVPSKQAV